MAQIDPKQIKQAGATDGQVMTWDNAAGEWAPDDAAGGAGDQMVRTGFTTTGLGDGDFGYVSSANTVTKTDAASEAASEVIGANEGTAGSMTVGGIIENAKFTTDGGSPSNGSPVYLALGTADASTGAGKLTATAPSTAGQVVKEVGTCIDNSNYAGSKTAVIVFQPKAAVVL